MNEEMLSKYQEIIQLNYAPYAWGDTAMSAFVKYIEQGRGGWVGFHHASLLGEFDGYPMWDWFSKFMGGIRFKNYIAAKASATVNIEDKKNPVMKGVPSSFVIPDDEWYTFNTDPRPNVHVIATVDESTYKPPSDIKMGDHPVFAEPPASEEVAIPDGCRRRGVCRECASPSGVRCLRAPAHIDAAGDRVRDSPRSVGTPRHHERPRIHQRGPRRRRAPAGHRPHHALSQAEGIPTRQLTAASAIIVSIWLNC